MEIKDNIFEKRVYKGFKNKKKLDISSNTRNIISLMVEEIFYNLTDKINNIEKNR